MRTLILLGLLFAPACGGDAPPPATPDAPEAGTEAEAPAASPLLERARQAGTVAAAIEQEPARAEAILAEHGLSRDEFEATLFEVAEDPEASSAYTAARQGG